MTKVNISQTQSKLKTIGVAAFADCKTLASITIPNRVEIIRHNAFINCKELETINIPSDVQNIGISAFFNTKCFSEFSNSNDYNTKFANKVNEVRAVSYTHLTLPTKA